MKTMLTFWGTKNPNRLLFLLDNSNIMPRTVVEPRSTGHHKSLQQHWWNKIRCFNFSIVRAGTFKRHHARSTPDYWELRVSAITSQYVSTGEDHALLRVNNVDYTHIPTITFPPDDDRAKHNVLRAHP